MSQQRLKHGFSNTPIYLSYGLIGLCALLRLWVAVRVPLIADEAHYGLYGLMPAWSYFDHPPLVGWLQFAALQISQQPWALRLIPISLHIVIAIQILQLSLRFDARPVVALIAVMIFETSPLLQLMGIGLVPDLPLAFFSLLLLHLVVNLQQQSNLKNWLLLAVVLGLMGLSKYTAIIFALALILWILRFYPRWLLNYKPWLAALIALLIITPVIYWNYANDWLSFNYQINHGELRNDNVALRPFVIAQIAFLYCYGFVLFPISFSLAKTVLRSSIKAPHSAADKAKTLIAYMVILYWLVFAYSSAKDGHFLPHWLAVSMIIATIPVAQILLQLWQHSRLQKAVVITLSLITLAQPMLLTLIIQYNIMPNINQTLFKQFAGWQQVAKVAKNYADKLTQSKIIYLPNWSQASRVAWYGYPNPVQPIDSKIDQFDLWYGSFTASQDGILVAHTDDDQLAKALQRLQQCQLLENRTYTLGGAPFTFGLWHCHGDAN